jgi:blocked-early-in-transport protein 1
VNGTFPFSRLLLAPLYKFRKLRLTSNFSSQNNALLDSLSAKVSTLRGVTVDIYDNARNHDIIDSNADVFSSFGTSLRNSAGRLGRMAQSGNKVSILKLAGIIIGVVILLWWIGGWLLSGSGSKKP